jgi:hypothetical protein
VRTMRARSPAFRIATILGETSVVPRRGTGFRDARVQAFSLLTRA